MRVLWLGITISLMMFSSSALSYGKLGHQTFCQMTYELLSPAAQEKIDAQVASTDHSESFAELCTWADRIKSDDKWDWAKPHHYVNFAHDAAQVTYQDCPRQGCILSALRHHYSVLEHNADNVESLAFFAHFMGDLHQPMHVSFADDLGGNRAELEFFEEPSNLHYVWDTGLLVKRGGEDWLSKAQQLLDVDLPKVEHADDLYDLKWANESAAVTRRIYSNYNEGMNIGEGYVNENAPILEHRMRQGAERLADLLEHLYTNN